MGEVLLRVQPAIVLSKMEDPYLCKLHIWRNFLLEKSWEQQVEVRGCLFGICKENMWINAGVETAFYRLRKAQEWWRLAANVLPKTVGLLHCFVLLYLFYFVLTEIMCRPPDTITALHKSSFCFSPHENHIKVTKRIKKKTVKFHF